MNKSKNLEKKKILITGVAGFIGFHLANELLSEGHSVFGVDNINDYYDVNLKYDRLRELGIDKERAEIYYKTIQSTVEGFKFQRVNLEDKKELKKIFDSENFEIVVNLAAQAGVRYSIENPDIYVQSNVVGFLNLLECCRHSQVEHLVYASSSSVYGENSKVPFSTEDNVARPISLYAATKKSNELMAYTYSHLYGFKTTGLRFFTVYGPWGRPDMAMFLFTDSIINRKPVRIFNNGNLERDFTYIDDIVEGVAKVVGSEAKGEKATIYNIGNSQPVKLIDFISEIEKQLETEAEKEYCEMQPGDVKSTWADVSALQRDFNYHPVTPISKGVKEFINWYKSYYCTTSEICQQK